MSLGDIVQRVLEETDWAVGNEELAREISERIPEEHLRSALQDALLRIIPMAKNVANKSLVMRAGRPPRTEQPVIQGTEGRTYVSPRTAYFNEKRYRFLNIGFQGVRGPVQFRTATHYEIVAEALRLEKHGMSTLARAELFRKVAEEMKSAGAGTAAELPVSAQEEFADRFRDLYRHDEDE